MHGRTATNESSRARNEALLQTRRWTVADWGEIDDGEQRTRDEFVFDSVVINDGNPLDLAGLTPGPDGLLITFAVRDSKAISELVNVIREAGDRWVEASLPVAIVHCENDPGPSWATLVEHFSGSTVECLDSMVDRVCPEITTDSGRVTVFVEPYSQWAVEPPRQPQLAELIGQLASERVVNLVMADDLTRARKVKRLLLNGTDLCLGVAAFAAQVPLIRDSPASARAIIDDLLSASAAIGALDVDEALHQYAAAIADRLSSSLNGVSSTIQRFNLFQLDEFFRNADFKMGDELRWLLSNRPESPVLGFFESITTTFRRGDRLVDPPSSMKDAPPPISQQDVLDAFDELVGDCADGLVTDARSCLLQATSLLD